MPEKQSKASFLERSDAADIGNVPKMRLRFSLLASLVSGLLLAVAFPPLSQSDTVWFAFVPLLFALRLSSPREGFRLSFVSGLAFWLVSLSWLWMLKDNGGPLALVVLGHIALAAYCALYTALFGTGVSFVWSLAKKKNHPLLNGLLALLAEPALWVGTEYLRGIVLTGFPWNPIAASQYRNIALLSCVSWAGVGLIAVLVIAVNGGITSMGFRIWRDVFAPRFRRGEAESTSPARPHSRFQVRSAELAIALTATVLIWMQGVTALRQNIRAARTAPKMRAAIVHPDAPCIFEKDDASVAEANKTLLDYTSLAADARPDVCFWPETSLPGYIPYDETSYKMVIKAVDDLHGSPLLVGAVELRYREDASADDDYDIYNSAFLFGRQAGIRAMYRKQHLVPFGEYIPLETKLPILKKLAPTGFSCTPGDSSCLFRLPIAAENGTSGYSTGALICFEDAFPYLSRHAVKEGADILATLANDAWFDGSCESEQHLAQAVLRCAENRRPMIRCTNRGVSAVIDENGRILRRIGSGRGAGEPGFAVHELPVRHHENLSPYTKHGDWLLHIPCAIFTGVVLLALSRGVAAATASRHLLFWRDRL